MLKKNKIIHLPKLSSMYVKSIFGQHPRKYPVDFVETLIEERKKQLMKEKHVQKNKV